MSPNFCGSLETCADYLRRNNRLKDRLFSNKLIHVKEATYELTRLGENEFEINDDAIYERGTFFVWAPRGGMVEAVDSTPDNSDYYYKDLFAAGVYSLTYARFQFCVELEDAQRNFKAVSSKQYSERSESRTFYIQIQIDQVHNFTHSIQIGKQVL